MRWEYDPQYGLIAVEDRAEQPQQPPAQPAPQAAPQPETESQSDTSDSEFTVIEDLNLVEQGLQWLDNALDSTTGKVTAAILGTAFLFICMPARNPNS